ncbi:HET-domain-containing protein [Stemphylium lycopersici]|uniref:HET-domain-containing protein n=1 Tax=Stemphylium lycopersici TaxID=183478 RepID=A0A364N751_STELY|nr:HET-domain-containing protein [Stemphylium lycopersici]
MASIRRSAASALSRILTLRYQPLCARCSKMLKGWEDGCPHSWEWDWHTTIGNLKDDSRTCSCCQFLVQALDASPWIQHKNQDELHIRTEHVGSQHSRSPLSKDQASTDFKAYYRPVLCVAWRPGDDHGRRSNSMDLGRNCTWILPEATAHTEIECSLDPQTFCGRRIGPLVDFSLIRGWLKTCTRSHQGREHKEPQKETDQVDSPESDCRPNRRESIPDFRLVDVHKRCVVRANPAEDYAALSYVWGNAKRLLLCESTQDWLSTPGALSPDEDRIPQTFKDTLKVAETLGISHVWIDALCINQTDMKQVESHMNAMGSIYGAALLTIVSNTENADTGIPGVSLLRGFPQASFHRKGISYLSARKTFAQALERSPWQKRAWCLQEKLFSKRLLIFTSSQAFYHCDAATWFEDTIMEPKDKYSTSLQVSEKVWIDRKSKEAIQRCTAYESYRSVLYERGFWSLVEDYSQRQLSFDGDAIRAFAGILKSVESQHGVALWGIPQYHFIRGISWYHTEHKAHLRRGGVPSWSWAGWRTDANNSLKFASCKRRDTDVGFSHGQYRVACGKRAQPSVWDIQWYYYAFDENSGQMETTTVQLEPGDTGAESRGARYRHAPIIARPALLH